jgi:alkylation response protein AidB-like acyl-CoA dehydrogenase
MKDLPDWYVRNSGITPDMESEEFQKFNREWHKKLHDAGYVGIAWPKEYGGRGATLMEQVIFNEEMATLIYRGIRVVLSGKDSNGQSFAYFDTREVGNLMVKLVEVT